MGEALMDDDMQGWAHQCELEYRRFEEETNANQLTEENEDGIARHQTTGN
jgi:hypothetical protein